MERKNIMRIIVLSDTHRRFREFYDIVQKHQREAHLFIHLGDGQREVDDMLEFFPDLPLICVKGNCDYGSMLPEVRTIEAGGVKILCTHGHALSVKSTLEPLKKLAVENSCRIALYGHSHKSDTHYENGLYLMNPGSPVQPRDSKASYGIIDITPGSIFPFIVNL